MDKIAAMIAALSNKLSEARRAGVTNGSRVRRCKHDLTRRLSRLNALTAF